MDYNSSIEVPKFLERPKLIQQIKNLLVKSHVLLKAPGGYGKSTLLRALVAYLPNSFFFSLSKLDTDLAILKARLEPYRKTGNILLLDDVHLLEGAQESVNYLAEWLEQAKVYCLLAGRYIPFEYELLIMRNQAVVIDKHVLAFSLQEASDLFILEPPHLNHWHKKLEGWPLALSLLAKLPANSNQFPMAENQLFKFLAHAVFSKLPSRLLQFLKVIAVPIIYNEELAQVLWTQEADAKELFFELQTRNLYQQALSQEGWFKFHDLVREFLLYELGSKREFLAEQAVAWFLEHNRFDLAVEQAIEARLEDRKEQLISEVALPYFHKERSYLTYRRWVLSLNLEAQARHPLLLIRLGNVMMLMQGHQEEALKYIEQGEELARQVGDTENTLLARTNKALFLYKASHLTKAYELIQEILADPACQNYSRMFALRIACLIAGDLGKIAELPKYLNEVIPLCEARGAVNEPKMNLGNKVLFYLLPTGRFEQAQKDIAVVLNHFHDNPGWLGQYLIFWCERHVLAGDWQALAKTLKRLEESNKKVENVDQFILLWQAHYQAILAIAQSDSDKFTKHISIYEILATDKPLNQLTRALIQVWRHKYEGEYDLAVKLAESFLDGSTEAPYHRAQLALERDSALLLADESEGLHPETLKLIRMRAKPNLVRLRALLAVYCQRQNNPTWKKHFRATIRMLKEDQFDQILTCRDPGLGKVFWQLGLRQNYFVPESKKALIALSDCQVVLTLLTQGNKTTQLHCVDILVAIGDEISLPTLSAHLQRTKDPELARSFSNAIYRLEQTPPPLLSIKLIDKFLLQRGNKEIKEADWYRPVVKRLLQYFALHLGNPLTKEQILEDLWPGVSYEKAWKTFRSVYSLLRKVLEPYMPPKAPNRYFKVERDTYTFELTHVKCDFYHFETKVREYLLDEGHLTLKEFRDLLESYTVLLPELGYEDWLLTSRQKGNDLYIEGGLKLATCYLNLADFESANYWAERLLLIAPWLEEAYQVSMKAFSRRGKRSLALRAFERCKNQLKKELDISPSELSHWLALRLQQGEAI